ncbi:MAG: PIN domain nuclease [Candidatus Aminicenantes bacterium]|nr:PIN domain nuclease [Candidatus Aminicenantes bacterium]
MILVDSSVWIGYFNGQINPQTDWLDSALGREIIVVGDLILVEILQGFRSDRDFRKAKELLLNFQFMEMLGRELAIKSAENYRLLRRKGVTVRKAIDVIIGTFCIHHNLSLLHDDQDFVPLTKHLGLNAVKCG